MALDPYHIWLGIPPNEQPPDHYRLLGIQQFESDPNVISNAADRQMVFLRQFQSGENAELAVKLLNEVAAARVCLLSPENGRAEIREEYNRQLRGPTRPAMPDPISQEQVWEETARARRWSPPTPPDKSWQDATEARRAHHDTVETPPATPRQKPQADFITIAATLNTFVQLIWLAIIFGAIMLLWSL